ncbi:unnamed protein product [Closterium sp. NIES-54]
MTNLRVLLHVAAQRDYKLHSLDFSTAFLQGSLHEEIWLRRPPRFIGTFPPGTQWSQRRLVYSPRQAPREWHDTLRTNIAALGFHPSSADPSMFVRSGPTPFFVLVYVDDLVFATEDRTALAEVRSELQKRHTCTDLGELRRYLGLQITRDRAARTITLTQPYMVHSATQPTPLAVYHRLTGPFPDEPFESSGPYAELVGCLMYLMTSTRPELAFPLNVLSLALLRLGDTVLFTGHLLPRPAPSAPCPTVTATTATAATAAATAATAILRVAQLWLRFGFSRLIMRADRFSLTRAATAPPATTDNSTHSQWLTRDAAARLAIRNHLPLAECAHFGQHRTAQALYDAVLARYSSPATAALGRLLLPYLFPELSAFTKVEDLVSHVRASDACYRAAVPAEAHSLDPTSLTVDLLEQHLLAAETSAVVVGAARGTPRPPFFEGCSPSPLAPSYASATAAVVSILEDVGAASASAKRRSSKGKGGWGGGGGSGGGGGGRGSGGGGSSGGGGGGGTVGGSGGSGGSGGGNGGSGGSGGGGTGSGGTGARHVGFGSGQRQQQQRQSETPSPQQLREWFLHGASRGSCPYVIRTGDRAGQTCGRLHTQHRCFSRLDDAWRAEFGDDVELPRWADLLKSRIATFDLDFDAILSAMYALSVSAKGDCYQCVPPDPGIAAAALGASESGTLPGTAPAEALHTFTLDSGASRCFFRDSTTLTPLPAPVLVRLADPSGGPVMARSSTVLPWGQRVSICTCRRMGRHLATFTRQPGSSLYTLATEPSQVAASAQVSASGQVATSCSYRLLSQQTLLWHHRLGHPSLLRLRGMHSRLLVSGLPRSLPPLPPSPAPPYLPCIEGRQRAAPHSSSFPPMTAPLQTLHMDVWGPARVSGQSREHYFLLVVDDYTRYTTVFWTPPVSVLLLSRTQWSLQRPVYGLRQVPREWHDTLRTTLVALRFAPATTDPSLFLRTDTSLPPFYVLVYVDDLVFATADTKAQTLVKSELQKRHTCTDLGELRSYLGLQITRDRARRTINPTQSHMVHQVLQRFGFQFSSPQPTPLSSSHSLSAPPLDESIEPSGSYPELVGCLMYLMTCTRPDLAYPLSLLARYVAPGTHRKVHLDVAKRVLRYLCSTSGMGLVLGGRGPVVLTGHADAFWVDDSATQQSSQGYTFSLGSGSVSWRSTRSSSVLNSSCEAEIYAGAMAAQELRWLTYLLTDLGEQPRLPPVLYVDNKAMIALCQEHRQKHRMKHIALRYFLARELQQRGQLRLAYVATRANTADVFTKALPPGDHQRFATVLGLTCLLLDSACTVIYIYTCMPALARV